MKATFLRVSISTLALVLLAAISAFSQVYTGLSFRAKATDTTAFNFPAGYGGMTYFNGRLWLKDATGWFQPRKVIPALTADNFVFGTGIGIGTKSIYTGNDNVLVNMSTTASTFNSPSLINNTFAFSERSVFSPVGGLTDVFSIGDWHYIGDGTNFCSGCATFTAGNNNNNFGGSSFIAGSGAQVNYADPTSGGVAIALGGSNDRSDATYKRVTAGPAAVNISHNTTAQTSGNGALGLYSVIIGSVDAHIPSTSPRSGIGGGVNITARSSDPDQWYFPNLNIVSTPLNDDTLTQVLVRNPLTGQIKYRSASSLGGGASNALILGSANTRNPLADETTSVNLDYDFSIEQEFLIRSYALGDNTTDTGLRIATDFGGINARLYSRTNDGSEGYFKVNNFSDIEAKVSNPTNSFVQDWQVNTGSGAVTLTGTGSNNSYVQTGFKSGSYTFSGALASYQVVVDNGGGATGFLKLQVTNTSTTEPLIILDTPGNSGIRLFGNGSISTGNILKSKNNLGDSQWGSIDLSLPAAVGTSVLRMVNGGLGAALTDPNANKILAWDDTDNAIGFWTLGSGLSYDHSTHTLSSSGNIGGSTGGTDKAMLRADGTGGSTAQSSDVTISDAVSNVVTINYGNSLVISGGALTLSGTTIGAINVGRDLISSSTAAYTTISGPTLSSTAVRHTGSNSQSSPSSSGVLIFGGSSSNSQNGGDVRIVPGQSTGGGNSGVVRILGTPLNDSATAGDVGENIESSVSTYTNYTTSATYQNVTSITLTPGDWDLSAAGTIFGNSATMTAGEFEFVISTTTASSTGAVAGRDFAYGTVGGISILHDSRAFPTQRISLSSSTTYYLNTKVSFSAGNPQFAGFIRARRAR